MDIVRRKGSRETQAASGTPWLSANKRELRMSGVKTCDGAGLTIHIPWCEVAETLRWLALLAETKPWSTEQAMLPLSTEERAALTSVADKLGAM